MGQNISIPDICQPDICQPEFQNPSDQPHRISRFTPTINTVSSHQALELSQVENRTTTEIVREDLSTFWRRTREIYSRSILEDLHHDADAPEA